MRKNRRDRTGAAYLAPADAQDLALCVFPHWSLDCALNPIYSSVLKPPCHGLRRMGRHVTQRCLAPADAPETCALCVFPSLVTGLCTQPYLFIWCFKKPTCMSWIARMGRRHSRSAASAPADAQRTCAHVFLTGHWTVLNPIFIDHLHVSWIAPAWDAATSAALPLAPADSSKDLRSMCSLTGLDCALNPIFICFYSHLRNGLRPHGTPPRRAMPLTPADAQDLRSMCVPHWSLDVHSTLYSSVFKTTCVIMVASAWDAADLQRCL
jgi:hypothetical protein